MHILNYFIFYWKPVLLSLISLMLICLTNMLFVLPISGIYLLIYVAIVAMTTTWVSFITIQNFLQQNKPLDLSNFLKSNKKIEGKIDELNNVECVKSLTVDIDEHFIKKWFVYISSDDTFNKESRLLLEDILKKIMNVQLLLDKETVIQGVLNLYLKHLKEFRRSLKRRDKYSGKISDLYRYSHVCSTSRKAKHYYMHQLTINLLNHFINWELSNSLPYKVLVSVISKKVMVYLLNLFSNPEFLNYAIIKICASESKKNEINLANYGKVKIIKVTDMSDLTPNLSKTNSNSNLAKNDTKAVENSVIAADIYKKLDAPRPKLKSLKHDEPNKDVKIYEPKSCSTTWYDSMDLDSITLGQDILDMLGDDKDSDNTNTSQEKEVVSPITSAKNLLDEVKHMTEQMTSLEGIKTSMKPLSDATITNFKDLQESTVNSVVKPVSQATSTALHKIGGLHLQDEAAGVVEGLLDFGRTKIRKGLRLTGLQENSDLLPAKQKKNIVKMPRVSSQEKAEELTEDSTWINPLQEDHKSEPIDIKTVHKVPSILTQDDGSPEPEYEETADLATSIAKLRTLLEQKSSGSNLSTPSALSPMPNDDKSLFNEDAVDEADGMMPSFYKFCAKTATGVINNTLNTIKTALPGNVNGADRLDGVGNWLFVEANSSESDLSVRMHKLLCERKVFCTVDTAYEAFDSLGSLHENNKLLQSNIHFEDELDDFEVKLPVTKALFDVICELLADNKETSLAQEPVIKSTILLFGNYIEETIITEANFSLQYLCSNAKIPTDTNSETLEIEFDSFINIILSGIPDYVRYFIGDRTLKEAVHLLISSLQVQRINQDLVMQIFEIVCLKLMDGSKQLSPLPA